MASTPDLVLFYSAPLVWFDKDGQAQPIDSLDFSTERDCLFDSFHEAGRALKVRVAPATADNFRTLVTLGCRVLHYSGHGHPDFLAFEDGKGGMHGLDAPHLKNLFAAGGARGVQCIFVSACHSRKAGEAFVTAGVPHVVAVRLETPVYDDAARSFARAFYLSLANGDSIKQAFDIGRAAVATNPDLPNPDEETEKFLLLPEYGRHEATIFADAHHRESAKMSRLRHAHTMSPPFPSIF